MPFKELSEELKARVEHRVQEIEQRLERGVRSLLTCLHQRQADQCHECKGKTEFGVPMDYVVQALREHGLLEVELAAEFPSGDGTPIQHRRSLKTIVGIGIGVSFFLGIAGWQGGKLIARLIKRDAAPPKR